MSGTAKLFLVSVEVVEYKEGIDLPRFLSKVNSTLQDYATASGSPATHVMYKFKVTGESRVVAVVQVNNVIGFERTMGGLARLGYIKVSSVPIVSYESFAQFLGVDISLATNPNRPLPDQNIYYWSFDVGYTGKTADEFLQAWKREAEFVLGARAKEGFNVELYKVVAERKIHVFLQVADPVQLDQLAFQLPIMRENGHNIRLECRAVQYLPDYCNRIFNDQL